jgi:hypothetical protein
MSWTYEDYYFGNANYPSGYLWRVDRDRRELLMEYPLYLGSREDAQGRFEAWADRTGLAGIEPVYHEDDQGRVQLQWWAQLRPEDEETEYAFSKRAGMGEPSRTEECPYMFRDWKPLY